MKRNVMKWVLPLVVLMSACSKNDSNSTTVVKPASGVYVLSEGNYGSNNTELSYYDFGTSSAVGSFYSSVNGGSKLGDTGNDVIIYGGKMYIVMNVTGNVTIADAGTAKLIKKIDFTTGGVNKNPRYAAGGNGKVYVSCYDGTVAVIDTVTLAITKSITVGSDPEGVAIAGNYLYVANSGGLNPTPDSTVSVVDLTTQTEIKKIVVGVNPNKVEINSLGDVYVTSYGNFTTIPASVHVIDSKTNTWKTSLGTGYKYSHLRIYNDVAYFYNNYGEAGCKLLNTKTNTTLRNEFVTDSTKFSNIYGVNIDENNGDVYITDAKNFSTSGSVTCFDKDGKKKFSFSVSPGISPNKVVFLRK